MKLLTCSNCGNRVFFENMTCGSCGALLAYAPHEQEMVAFEEDAQALWHRLGPPGVECRSCANRAEQVCNWVMPADSPHRHCVSCRTTHTIPALGKPENRGYWATLEQEKRRLFYTLIELGLPTPNKVEDPANGLSFEFLEQMSVEQRVLTGHDEGVITLNIAEADDAQRERIRLSMHEPYRTLLGHFRHEIGHYYWDRLVRGTNWIDEYRTLFGDERLDYAEALKKHYAEPRLDWPQQFISVYASSHPWEDWAETWAHYLHMFDGLDTAAAWGMHLDLALPGGPALTVQRVDMQKDAIAAEVVEQWLPVSQFINAMDRSLGSRDSYPFVVVQPVVEKLGFIHRVINAARRGDSPMNFAPPPVAADVPTAGSEGQSDDQEQGHDPGQARMPGQDPEQVLPLGDAPGRGAQP